MRLLYPRHQIRQRRRGRLQTGTVRADVNFDEYGPGRDSRIGLGEILEVDYLLDIVDHEEDFEVGYDRAKAGKGAGIDWEAVEALLRHLLEFVAWK